VRVRGETTTRLRRVRHARAVLGARQVSPAPAHAPGHVAAAASRQRLGAVPAVRALARLAGVAAGHRHDNACTAAAAAARRLLLRCNSIEQALKPNGRLVGSPVRLRVPEGGRPQRGDQLHAPRGH
jgi:hypothetical protein